MRVPRHAEIWTIAAVAGLAAFSWVLVRGGASEPEPGRGRGRGAAQLDPPPSDPDGLERWLARNPSHARSWLELGNMRADQGREAEARNAWLKAETLYESYALRGFRNPVGSWYNFACVRARLGKPGEAIAALERAVEFGWLNAEHTVADPDFVSLRPDGRFEALVDKMRSTELPPIITDP